MKFARYLEEQQQPEWTRAYIRYRPLKRLIKEVDAHRRARMALVRAQQPPSPPTFGFARTFTLSDHREQAHPPTATAHTNDNPPFHLARSLWAQAHPLGPADHTASVDMAEQGEAHARHRHSSSPHLPAAAADQPSPVSASGDASSTVAPAHAPKVHIASPPTSGSASPEEGSGLPPVPLPTQLSIDPHATIVPPYSATQTGTQSADKSSDEEKAPDEPTRALLHLLLATFDAEERKIFAVLDTEMARMLSFYEERRNEAETRFEQIAIQLKDLAEHRVRYRASLARAAHYPAYASGVSIPGRTSATIPRIVRKKASMEPPAAVAASAATAAAQEPSEENDPGYERRAQAIKAIHSVVPGAVNISLPPVSVAAVGATGFDPERYKSARRAVKGAMLELYRQLHILQTFQFLCRVGMVKILKKASKTWGVPVSEPYLAARVNNTALVTDDSVSQLVRATEDLYAAFYEHGDRKKAVERLRSTTGGTTIMPAPHHLSAFRAGLFTGVAVCATCAGLVQAMRPDTKERIPDWQALMRVYGAFMIVIVFAALYGINLLVWHNWRVNAPFIFQFDLRSTLHPMQYFPFPCLLTMILAIFFWLSFLDPFPGAIAPTTWPLVRLSPRYIARCCTANQICAGLGRCFCGAVDKPVSHIPHSLARVVCANGASPADWGHAPWYAVECAVQGLLPRRRDEQPAVLCLGALGIRMQLRRALALRILRLQQNVVAGRFVSFLPIPAFHAVLAALVRLAAHGPHPPGQRRQVCHGGVPVVHVCLLAIQWLVYVGPCGCRVRDCVERVLAVRISVGHPDGLVLAPATLATVPIPARHVVVQLAVVYVLHGDCDERVHPLRVVDLLLSRARLAATAGIHCRPTRNAPPVAVEPHSRRKRASW